MRIRRQAVTGRNLRIRKLFLYFEVSNADKLSRLRNAFRPDVAVNILRDADDHPYWATVGAGNGTEMSVFVNVKFIVHSDPEMPFAILQQRCNLISWQPISYYYRKNDPAANGIKRSGIRHPDRAIMRHN